MDEVICMVYEGEPLCVRIMVELQNACLYVDLLPFSRQRPSSWLLYRNSTEYCGPVYLQQRWRVWKPRRDIEKWWTIHRIDGLFCGDVRALFEEAAAPKIGTVRG
jgi:hypothetical protein